MAAGEIPLPPAGVDVAYLVFEDGQIPWSCQGGRSLVADQRRAVLAGSSPQVSYSLVQRGLVGMPERERLLVVGEGFAVGVQATRVVPGHQVVPRGLGVLSREPVVAGDLAREGVRLASAGPARERGGGAAVQEALASQTCLPVDQGPELVVVEVVGWTAPDGADLPDQTARVQLFEGVQGLFFSPAARRPDRVEVERPSDGGCGGEYLPRRLADRPEAGLEEVLHPSRQGPGVVPDV